jgi:hypothetical protein
VICLRRRTSVAVGLALFANFPGAAVDIMISNSVINLPQNGIAANAIANGSITATIRDSEVTHASGTGLLATGPGAKIICTRSVLTGNATGANWFSSGVVATYGDNVVDTLATGSNFTNNAGLTYR